MKKNKNEKKITEEDQFKSSLLFRQSSIEVKGEKKIKNEISPYLVSRSKKVIEGSFLKSKYTKDELQKDEWVILKSPKLKWKVSKNKKENVFFEDRVWALFTRMGADLMNRNSNDTVLKYGRSKTKKVDVFAVMDEIVIIVECKCANTPNTNLTNNKILDEIAQIKQGATQFLETIFPGFTVVYALATKNYTIGSAFKKRMQEDDIFLLDENKLEYYEYLNGSLSKASRYQFFAEIFKDQSVHNFQAIKVNAIQKKNIDDSYTYTFFVRAKDLLRIAYVFHTESYLDDEKKGYQRLVKPARRKQVEDYIKGGGFFPNSLIVSLNEKIEFDKVQDVDPYTEMGTLTLPNKYASAFIIDGQHRLYGYANLEDPNFLDGYDVLPVTAFTDLDSEDQVNLFVDINSKQKPVSPSLLLDLRSDLWWRSDNVNEAISALRTRLITNLGSSTSSPLYNRIKIGQKQSTRLRCITVDYVLKYALNKTNFFGKYNGRTFLKEGWFLSKKDVADKNYDKALKKSQAFLGIIFSKIQETLPDMWSAGNDKNRKAFIAMNIGVFSMIRLCDYIIKFRVSEGDDFNSMTAENMANHVWTHLKCVIEHIGKLDDDSLAVFRGYSTGGINEIAVKEFLVILNINNSKITSPELEKYLKEKETEFNKKTPPIVMELEIRIRSITIDVLSKKYPGVREWYEKGVPLETQKKASSQYIDNNRKGEAWNYFYLLDYLNIISFNKNELLPVFTMPGDEQKKENEKLKWFSKLNDIRNKASHPTREPITQEEYDFVKNLDTWLISPSK